MASVNENLKRALSEWITSEKRKPMIAWGPPQSGKKTLLRAVLKELKYCVIEPKARADDNGWKQYGESGLHGRMAYLMHTSTTGLYKLPKGIGAAPVLYVCDNLQNHGGKAKLEKNYQIVEMRGKQKNHTDLGDGKRMPALKSTKDTDLKPWEAVSRIGNNRSIDEGLRAVELSESFLLQQVAFANLVNGKTDEQMDQIAACSDLMSFSDHLGYRVPTDHQILWSILAPVRLGKLHQITKLHFKDESKHTCTPECNKSLQQSDSALLSSAAKRCRRAPAPPAEVAS
jgi:hypothetical protein